MPAKARTVQVRHIAAAGDVDRELRRVAGVSRATSHRWRSRPDFPRPFLRTRRLCLWDMGEVRVWLAQRTEETE